MYPWSTDGLRDTAKSTLDFNNKTEEGNKTIHTYVLTHAWTSKEEKKSKRE